MRIVRNGAVALSILCLSACSEETDGETIGPVITGMDASSSAADAASADAIVKADSALADATSPQDANAQVADGGNGRDATVAAGEPGRLMGITAAHNVVRAAAMSNPKMPDLIWSDTIAAFAQEWADSLAQNGCGLQHHDLATLTAKGYGENLAQLGANGTAQQAVTNWAAEKTCWTYGTVRGTEKCDATCARALGNTQGSCGHYTQLVWSASTHVGCGMAVGRGGACTIWACNYSPAGNFVGKAPYPR
jgi:pathogenesis-related protein 1